MATQLHDLSKYETEKLPSAASMSFGIVVSEWNEPITKKLLEGAYNTLLDHNVLPENIMVRWVPGSFELPLAAQLIANTDEVDAVICLGCVIQGETRHFDFICNAVSQAIMQLNVDTNMPFIFGVLTTETLEQAEERAGGKLGNKGTEAAVAAIKMAVLTDELAVEEDFNMFGDDDFDEYDDNEDDEDDD